MTTGTFREFATREQLADALADAITAPLIMDAQSRKSASVAFSGGSTPRRLFETIGVSSKLFSESITVTLVDERRVDSNHQRSNERLLSETLFKSAPDVMKKNFVPLFHDGDTADADCRKTCALLEKKTDNSPLTVAVLGMGNDGHTASWFPGGDNLQEATNGTIEKTFIPMNAPGAGEERITMTIVPIASARHVFLHIEGDEKRAVYEKALEDGNADDLPIRHILRHPEVKVDVYWAP